MFDKIVEIYRDMTGDETTEISPKTRVNDELSLSSLGKVQLICEIEDRFDITISSKELKGIKTVQDIVECVEKKINN
ncbi:MAG: acyl carrier protein [Clostridiales bacterium]|nr:acyl carrier protein [Clostridiales bacterium]